jgi:hypothetical protein
LFREADIEVPPDCSIHEHYQSERFREIKASSQQSCGTDNRTERLTLGTHDPDHRMLHREIKTSLLESLTSRPHSLQRSARVQNRKWNWKINIYHAPDDHLPGFALIHGCRVPRKWEKKFFHVPQNRPKSW